MTEIVFDIETNGLLRRRPGEDTAIMDRVHCVAWARGDEGAKLAPQSLPIEALISQWMETPSSLIGHNILTFDIPALQSVYPWFKPTGPIIDTKILCQLAWPDVKAMDIKMRSVEKGMPSNLVGTHKLAAWGYRLGVLKGTYGETADWSIYTPEMGEYCRQDVRVTKVLWEKLKAKNLPQMAIEDSHRLHAIVDKQQRRGWCFNLKGAQELQRDLEIRKAELDDELMDLFPPRVFPGTEDGGISDADMKKYPFWAPKSKLNKFKAIEETFNPGSDIQIAYNLMHHRGWKPKVFTDDAETRPSVTYEVLDHMDPKMVPEAPKFSEYMKLKKVYSMLCAGKAAHMKFADETGEQVRIHGGVYVQGAVSGRDRHMAPNVSQTPSVRKYMGKRFRSLYQATPGWRQVGVDASALELCCQGHYLEPFDGGAYINLVTDPESDIHSINQEAAGLPTRDIAKRFIYAMYYGAGKNLLAQIMDGTPSQAAKAKKKFFDSILGMKELLKWLKSEVKQHGGIFDLYGVLRPSRSEHSAFNLLLQSAGAAIMARANVALWDDLGEDRQDVYQVGRIHDEYQLESLPGIANDVGQAAVRAIQGAGAPFGFKCRLDAEYRVGNNWAETH